MSFFTEEHEKRKLPEILRFKDGTPLASPDEWEKRRLEMIDIVGENMFGKMPPKFPVRAELVGTNDRVVGKKVVFNEYIMFIDTPRGKAHFTFYEYRPKDKTNVPTFVHIAFKPEAPHRYTPVEQIIDRGFGIVLAYQTDVTSDDGDFSSGIAKYLPRSVYNIGKITLWAYAQSCLVDHVMTLDWVDKTKIASIGHSRLGKTSLWCAANDTRITYCVSNNAGCSGDAVTRQKRGETLKQIYNRFPYWFVEKYGTYQDDVDALPFDQHFLLAAIAPRKLAVGSADLDVWADPHSQLLACMEATKAYKFLGMKGLVCEDRLPDPGDVWQDGDISFHETPFGHLLGSYDWDRYMDFIEK